MTYALVVVIVRSLVEGIKKIVPALKSELYVKILVGVLTAAFVLAYRLNVMAEVGKASTFLPFDYVLSILILSIAAMLGNDILDLIARK